MSEQASDRLLSAFPDDSRPTTQMVPAEMGDLPMPSTLTVRKMNELAISKLAEITRRKPDNAYYSAEVVAAKDLLERSTETRQR